MPTKNGALFVAILFTAFLILSNLTAEKLVHVWHFEFTAALAFFPITYVFGDILTEVYGYKVSRYIIWSALLANALVILGAALTVVLPASPDWPHQQAYAAVFYASPRVFLASVLGYLVGEFSNSTLLAMLKIKTQGAHLWLRLIVSTVVGVGLDSIIFTHVAFYNLIPYSNIWVVIGSMYGFKVIYEIIALPLTYKITDYLKHKDHSDVYDTDTRFNPFSLKL